MFAYLGNGSFNYLTFGEGECFFFLICITVRYVDDIGSLGVAWDNGSTLQVVYGEDICRRCDDDR